MDLATGTLSHRTYADSLNPPILHRKELLLPAGDPRREAWAALTAACESIWLFDDPRRIGYKRQWQQLVRERGYRIVGDFDERLEALTRAWFLTRPLLVVSVMLANQNDPRGQRFRDGVMTKRGTFQKYFSHGEIKAFIEQVLDAEPIAVAQANIETMLA